MIEEVTGVDDGVGLKLPGVVDHRLDGCLVVGVPGLRPELDQMSVARMDQAECSTPRGGHHLVPGKANGSMSPGSASAATASSLAVAKGGNGIRIGMGAGITGWCRTMDPGMKSVARSRISAGRKRYASRSPASRRPTIFTEGVADHRRVDTPGVLLGTEEDHTHGAAPFGDVDEELLQGAAPMVGTELVQLVEHHQPQRFPAAFLLLLEDALDHGPDDEALGRVVQGVDVNNGHLVVKSGER